MNIYIILLIGICSIVWCLDRYIPIKDPKCKYKIRGDQYPFKSGDIILTAGTNILMSVFGESNWHHVAMIYQCPDFHQFYVWEIRVPPVDTITRITSGTIYRAARLIPVYRFLEKIKHNETLCVRPINKSVDSKQFRQIIKQKWNTTFAFDYIISGGNRFFDYFSIPITSRKTHTARYCAEFIAETMETLGVFDFKGWTRSTSELIPKDYGEFTECLPLTNKYSFGSEILLKPYMKSKHWKSITMDQLS